MSSRIGEISVREKLLSHRSTGTATVNKFIDSKRNPVTYELLRTNLTDTRASVRSRFSTDFLTKRKSLAYSPKKPITSTLSAKKNFQTSLSKKSLTSVPKKAD
jgi:hypothetical protein